ncbi:DnaJ domain-containing protein [Pyronema domesticum]|uniref:Similar to Uncharacterized J domain-containing protein C1778.01c acc. no. Q9Y7I8 n=1 Tax=Pyronema omphalodes (strain CBS 100304) TaxID=1076935 RepID=U4KZS2_PYROM|nr:DnaJ domain-containing protein [Pyronema domesticum]CCX05214.1 Similar to Uncharacterized J domain-containing protein C1778.01c; acc. no. Q9Y7I8 [Pyronema omphalodes CBS 100304]
MASSIKIDSALPVFSGEWSAEGNFVSHAAISAPVNRKLEPLGPHFLAHARRKRHQRTFSEDDRIQASQKVKNVEDEDAGEISEPEEPEMLRRDPKDWKNQDHYAVLGLSKYRWRATEEQIKKAHRRKVLKHHPDKKAAASAGGQQDDSFFKCIQKAMEILSDPVKRRQFDSVDENAEVEPPTKKSSKSFYKGWAAVFAAEGRFSKKQPIPSFGGEKSTKEEVDEFYNFFYNFDSWRTFEYLDEDVPDDNENRDQKRHVERKNNAARKKRKSEDIARLRELVDKVLALDPRIKVFKEQEKERRNAKKNAREAEEKRLAEEAAKKAEEDAKKAAAEAEAAKAAAAEAQKNKKGAKDAVKKNRRVLKSAAAEFAPAGSVAYNQLMEIQDKINPDQLAELVAKLNVAKGTAELKAVYAITANEIIAKGAAPAGAFDALIL